MTQIFIDTSVLTSVTLIRLDISRFIKRIFVSEFLFYLASDKNTLFEAYLVIVDTSCEFFVSRLGQNLLSNSADI